MVVVRQSIFFCTYTKKRGAGDVSPQVYRRNRIIRQLKFLETSLQAAQPPYFEIAIQRHVPPAMQDVYGWLVDEPCPTDSWRTQPRVRTCLGADAVASRCRCGCISSQTRFRLPPRAQTIIIQAFFHPLPTFQHSNEAAIRRKEGTIKRERVISLP